MKRNIPLSSILKMYGNILWYAAAGNDCRAFDVFSPEKLEELVGRDNCPDCFILTDYDVSYREDSYIIKGAEYRGYDDEIIYDTDECRVTAFNHRQIKSINVGFDPDMVTFDPDGQYYGNVYIMDLLIEYDTGSRYVSKLIYIVTENTRFIYNYLLKNKIKIKILVRANYGYGFGGGRSTGMFLLHLLKDLGAEFFANDLNTGSEDIAERYLTDAQRAVKPKLRDIENLTKRFDFNGYNDVILYHVDGFYEETEV